MNTSVELLAPAGNLACLHAAVRAGADAVYLGLDSFNARRGADNFTLETLGDACDYAHLRGVSVYLTMNTIIMPSEFDRALETARQAYRCGVDAFIVQDIGLASELARTLPQARVHASTQMNIHSADGVEAAALLGAKRITLARELSLTEIAHLAAIASELDIEVETFIHGAICVCYSGQCLMSSLIGGRSANRGMCAQACRLPYELHNKALRKNLPSPGDHLLSPKDLCALDKLDELVAAGVSSLKIEGRMKSPEYVFAVVSVYREALDAVLANKAVAEQTKEAQKLRLSEAFSRGFTTAYMDNERGNDMMSYARPNNRGVFIGRVERVAGKRVTLASEQELCIGDVLEFWTNKGHFAQTVTTLSQEKEPRQKETLYTIEVDKNVKKGDRVFRVRSAQAAFEESEFEPRVAVDGRVIMRLGQPLTISFWPAQHQEGNGGAPLQCEGVAVGDVVEAARTKAVSEDDVALHVDRLGQTPFTINKLDIELDDGVGVGFSQLHRLRAAALDDLAGALLAPYHERTLPRIQKDEHIKDASARGMRIVAWATNPACARAAKRAGADEIIVPILNYKRGEAVIAGQRSQTVEQAGYPNKITLAVPTVVHDPVEGTREEALDFDAWRPVRAQKPLFVESIGALVHAQEIGAVPEVGPHLPLVNSCACKAAARLGATRVWLSPELTLGQIADIAEHSPVELGLTIMGAQELMITEHCLLMSQGPCDENCDECPRRKSPHYLKDRKDFEFPVITDALGRSHLFNGVELDVAHTMSDLMSVGITAVMVDTTLMNVEQTTQAVARAVRARSVAHASGNNIAKTPSTTSGHLFRGVS